MKDSKRTAGFSLLELLAVLLLVSLLTAFIFNVYFSIQEKGKLSGTLERMKVIQAALQNYYRIYQKLPPAVNGSHVPVQADALNMESKYLFDQWGQFLLYNPGQLTDIQDVNGKAASLISKGPDQSLNTNGDNLSLFIDLTAQAKAIVMEKLPVLQEKARAYDKVFSSIDNDGDLDIDEDFGESAEADPNVLNTCPPTHSFINDPSQGWATLDQIEAEWITGDSAYANCTGLVVEQLIAFYELPHSFPVGYVRDPWNSTFAWGFEGRVLEDGTSEIDSTDPRYHRFYSQGPDATMIEDDIVYGGEGGY